MANNKTQPTDVSPDSFIEALEHPRRKADSLVLLDIMKRMTGWAPTMWGPSLIGFGQYHYKYDSGREGDFFRIGFSPRKANMTVYIMPGYQDFSDDLSRLGKHKLGKSCLYINKLEDVDMDVLEEIFEKGLKIMAQKYPDGA